MMLTSSLLLPLNYDHQARRPKDRKNPSGRELTLREAIGDLVERLKRMQHKCTYLEECRNQLVKEVIRLRLQNEWLAKQIIDSPEVSSSLPGQNPSQMPPDSGSQSSTSQTAVPCYGGGGGHSPSLVTSKTT